MVKIVADGNALNYTAVLHTVTQIICHSIILDALPTMATMLGDCFGTLPGAGGPTACYPKNRCLYGLMGTFEV